MSANGRRWLALALICSTSLMIVLDATIVNVALPAIQADLGFSNAGLAWVVNAYMLTFGGFMLLSGRTADLFGRRRMLMLGIAVFTLASLACGIATSQTMLVVSRGIQGVGASIVTAVALSMVLALFPEPGERAKAMSVWGFVGSGGGTVGVLLGGILTQSLNWHWIFLINVPIGVVVLLLARPLLPSTRGIGLQHGLDIGGTLAVLAAPILAVYGIVNAGQEGLTSPVTLACLGAAALIAVAFVLIESRVAAPLVPLSVLRRRTVAVCATLMALMGASMFGFFFFSPLYGRNILGFDALQTSLTFLPATLTMGVLSLGLTARFVERFGPKRPMIAGMLLFTVGHLLFARTPIDGAFFPDIAIPMFIMGVGAGIAFMPLVLVGTSEAAPHESGLISGVITTSQLIGGSIGLAMLAGVAAAFTATQIAAGADPLVATNDGYHVAFLVAAGLAAITAVLGATQLRESKVATAPIELESAEIELAA
jgi:EmrB/QacA subfamily drug resistance transporter